MANLAVGEREQWWLRWNITILYNDADHDNDDDVRYNNFNDKGG